MAKVQTYESATHPGYTAVQIDTEPGERVVIYLNDGPVYIGDPDMHEIPGDPAEWEKHQ